MIYSGSFNPERVHSFTFAHVSVARWFGDGTVDERDFWTCSGSVSLSCNLFVLMRLCGSAQTQSRETQRRPEADFSAPSWINFVFTDVTSCSVGRWTGQVGGQGVSGARGSWGQKVTPTFCFWVFGRWFNVQICFKLGEFLQRSTSLTFPEALEPKTRDNCRKRWAVLRFLQKLTVCIRALNNETNSTSPKMVHKNSAHLKFDTSSFQTGSFIRTVVSYTRSFKKLRPRNKSALHSALSLLKDIFWSVCFRQCVCLCFNYE